MTIHNKSHRENMSWYVHVQGPDDIIEADSEAAARTLADEINANHAARVAAQPDPHWPTVHAVVTADPRGESAVGHVDNHKPGLLTDGKLQTALAWILEGLHTPEAIADLAAVKGHIDALTAQRDFARGVAHRLGEKLTIEESRRDDA